MEGQTGTPLINTCLNFVKINGVWTEISVIGLFVAENGS